MADTRTISVSKKTAYQRPYTSRRERRAANRRKTDEGTDVKFLMKVAAGIGLLLLIAVGFAIKGMAERDSATATFPAAT